MRKYYSKPGFIPDDAETGDQDWIFMGGPGPGAPIHVSRRQPCFQDLSGLKRLGIKALVKILSAIFLNPRLEPHYTKYIRIL